MKQLLMLSVSCLFLLTPALIADDKAKPKDEQVKPADKDNFDQIIKDLVKSLKSATKVLTDVTDQKSADKAKPELEKVGQELAKIKERGDKIGQPSKEQETEFEKKYNAELQDAVKGVTEQTKRVLAQPFGKDLIAALQQKSKLAAKPEDKPKDK